MTDTFARPAVPTPYAGTAGHPAAQQDASRDSVGTVSLKSLANKVLQRDTVGDRGRDTSVVYCPSTHCAMGHSPHGKQAAQAEPVMHPLDERTALAGYGAGLPHDWAEGYTTLCAALRPATIPPFRWVELVKNAGHFLDRWGAQAAALGWNSEDIFGCSPVAPLARHDLQGLVFVVGSGEVVAITDATAIIKTNRGSLLTFRRKVPPEAARGRCLWDLCMAEKPAQSKRVG